MKLNSPVWKGYYKNKFTRTISRKHDYNDLYVGRERIKKMLDFDPKNIPDWAKDKKYWSKSNNYVDFATDYANQWITFIGHKNGLHFATTGFWGLISRLFGSFRYHLNFFGAFNDFVEELDELIESKRSDLEKPIRSIGFKK